MRYFAGIELAIPVVDRLALLQEETGEELHDAGGNVRWTPPQHIRLNLHVFGELEAATLPRVQDMLAQVATQQRPFLFQTHGLRFDRKPGEAQFLCTHASQEQDALGKLYQNIQDQAELVGFEPARSPWKPAVLIGRVATLHHRVDLQPIFERYEETFWGETSCQELILYRSQIVGREARVRVQKRFALGSGR